MPSKASVAAAVLDDYCWLGEGHVGRRVGVRRELIKPYEEGGKAYMRDPSISHMHVTCICICCDFAFCGVGGGGGGLGGGYGDGEGCDYVMNECDVRLCLCCYVMSCPRVSGPYMCVYNMHMHMHNNMNMN